MNNKQILKNKVTYLEKALMEADFRLKSFAYRIDELQEIIDKFKETGDQNDLDQNNDLVLSMMRERLKIGKRDYHMNIPIMPEDDMTRDNFYEAVQEALDLSIYLCAYMLRLMAEKEQNEGEAKSSGAKEIDKEEHENAKEKTKQKEE